MATQPVQCPIPGVKTSDYAAFPPQLQRLLVFIYESPVYKKVSGYCEDSGVSWASAKNQISRYNKKGLYFNDLAHRIIKNKLADDIPEVITKLVELAKQGSPKHMDMMFKMAGLIGTENKDALNTTRNTQHNQYFILGPSSVPELQAKSTEYTHQPKMLDVPEEIIDVEDKEK